MCFSMCCTNHLLFYVIAVRVLMYTRIDDSAPSSLVVPLFIDTLNVLYY